MNNAMGALVLPLLLACAAPSHGQDAQAQVRRQDAGPPATAPLSGDVLRRVLAGHFMAPANGGNGAEHFCESGRWTSVGGRDPVSGAYEIRSDRYCIAIENLAEPRCAQLFHIEGDLYYLQYAANAFGNFRGQVRVQQKLEPC